MTNLKEKQKYINNYLKVSKIPALICNSCGDSRKSAAGYLSHLEVSIGFLFEKLSNEC